MNRIVLSAVVWLGLSTGAWAQFYGPISGGSSSLVIGTTPISGGADTQVLFNSGGKISSDAGLTKVAGATGQVTVGGNLLMSGASYIISDVAFSSAINLNGAAVGFPRAASPTTFPGSVGDWGTGFNGFFTRALGGLSWSSGSSADGTSIDTSLCRLGAGIVEVGSGTACAATGILAAAATRSTGTVPTGNTGTCNTAVTVAGGATAGTWTSTAVCALGGTIILTGMPTQTTGYSCFMSDRTTNGVTINQSATTATSATFIVRSLPTGSVQASANDIMQYACTGY